MLEVLRIIRVVVAFGRGHDGSVSLQSGHWKLLGSVDAMVVFLGDSYLCFGRKAELRRSDQVSMGALAKVLPHIPDYLLVCIASVDVHGELVRRCQLRLKAWIPAKLL